MYIHIHTDIPPALNHVEHVAKNPYPHPNRQKNKLQTPNRTTPTNRHVAD